ncbi:MAG TPA: hypothetical protein VFV38_27825 [Ktedonobacteraceae bacterium]|nr:hypothetical protein [Ktedonobacteraceae bacterium]
MIKRDTASLLLFWLRRAAGIFLLLCEPLLVAGLLGTWISSTALEKYGFLFFIVWGIPLAFSLLRMPRQQRRVEALRMRMNETPLFAKQPALDVSHIVLPATLTLKLSRGAFIGFALFWLAMLGIFLLFQTPYWLALHILWLIIVAWLMLGTLVISLAALAFYQRIEASSEALVVQHGWRCKRIPWQEARLFAILGLDEKDNSRPYLYELSSARTILRWTHIASGPGFALQPRDRQEYWQRLDDLSAYIRSMTGLMLRDLR